MSRGIKAFCFRKGVGMSHKLRLGSPVESPILALDSNSGVELRPQSELLVAAQFSCKWGKGGRFMSLLILRYSGERILMEGRERGIIG
jgi:hypothetical protein